MTTIESLAIAASTFAAENLVENTNHAGWSYMAQLTQLQMETTVCHWKNKSVWGLKASAKALADAMASGADEKTLAYRGFKAEFAELAASEPKAKVKSKAKRAVTSEQEQEQEQEQPKPKAKSKAKRAIEA